MTSLVLPGFLLSLFFSVTNAVLESALYQSAFLSVGDFRQNSFSYLSVDSLASSMEADRIECTLLCVSKPQCYSFNIAASPDSKGLYLCELLASDKYRSKTKLYANATFHHYSPKTPCESDPCMNGAVCLPEYKLNIYHCDCKPGFCGTHCEQEETVTCSTIKYCNPNATTGYYNIDPDKKGGLPSFTVFCDMTYKSGIGVTVVSHDSEARKKVTGHTGKGAYKRDVVYSGVGVSQLANLTAVSAQCEQFIKYEYKHSRLLFNGDMWGWWVSRDGNKMTYWGGVNSVPYKCACGLSGACADPSDGCNCDKNDYNWREDGGMLANKSHLPVIQLRFGDTGGKMEIGYHTLGKLKCYGIKQELRSREP